MVTIGENLKLERREIIHLDSDAIQFKTVSGEVEKVAFGDIVEVELVGIKNNSGYSGTMEWGMKNPTFLLPTNFWFAILNWFKRKEDDVYYKMTIAGEKQFVVCTSKKIYKEICSRISMRR